MPYKILEHTADVRLFVKAKTLEKLFADAMQGMMFILKAKVKDQQQVKRTISVQSIDITALLIDFLNEVLLNTQTHKESYSNINFKSLTDKSLSAEIVGQKVELFEEDIKAATYHEADVRKNQKGEWETVVVFDI